MSTIEVRGLQKRYGSTVAVDGIDLDVSEGEIVGILGPNGSGKTTTVECIAGLRKPDAGTVRVAGRDPAADRAAITKIVGVQLQEAALQPKLTAGEAIALYSSFYDDPVDGVALAERLGLGPKLRTRFADLSGGQQQRLAIALALVGRPRIALLDELSTGLDPRSRRAVWQVVEEARETGTTIDPRDAPHGGGPAPLRPGRGRRPRPHHRARHSRRRHRAHSRADRDELHPVAPPRPTRVRGARARRRRRDDPEP